ncbi:MAG: LytTR family transcriptional regulator, partial [Tannerellaceae bacterium]|nr:LytTR family transcriptional regulator [Tannerellaceae bacterium]
MQPHPYTTSRVSILTGTLLILLGIALLWGLLVRMGNVTPLVALADASLFGGLLAVCGILSWYYFSYIRVWQAQIVMTLTVQALCLVVCYTVISLTSLEDIACFIHLLPVRLVTGMLYWIILMQGYHILHLKEEMQDMEKDEAPVELIPAVESAEYVDRISVKDGARIHIVHLDEVLYIQACGDYVTLFTPTGQYIKEKTMKFFDTYLPST